MESEWLSHAKRLQAIALTGLHFSRDHHDQERYRDIAEIAVSMLAQLADKPIERIANLVPDAAQGYMTPKVDVRGAVIDGGRILLVREKSDRLWALPGGFADVGLSAAENVVKELREEAGIDSVARYIYAVRHKAKGGYRSDVRDFYKLFFLCEPDGPMEPRPGPDTCDVGFFLPDALPPLSPGRTITDDILAAIAFRSADNPATSFD